MVVHGVGIVALSCYLNISKFHTCASQRLISLKTYPPQASIYTVNAAFLPGYRIHPVNINECAGVKPPAGGVHAATAADVLVVCGEGAPVVVRHSLGIV